MSELVIQMYEINIKKNYDLMDTFISKSNIYEDEYLDSIILKIENTLTVLEKETKYYIVEMNLNNSKGYNFYNTKINQANCKLQEYKKKLKNLKDKQLSKSALIINNPGINSPKSEQKLNEEKTCYNSFNKLQQCSRDINDIENMSGNIINGLNMQSSQMKGTSSKINLLNEDINSSSNILYKMLDRTKFDKKVILILGVFLFIVSSIVLVYKIVGRLK